MVWLQGERYEKDGGEGKANMPLNACWPVFALLYPAALKSQKVNWKCERIGNNLSQKHKSCVEAHERERGVGHVEEIMILGG